MWPLAAPGSVGDFAQARQLHAARGAPRLLHGQIDASKLSLRHSRSLKTLSIHRPRPVDEDPHAGVHVVEETSGQGFLVGQSVTATKYTDQRPPPDAGDVAPDLVWACRWSAHAAGTGRSGVPDAGLWGAAFDRSAPSPDLGSQPVQPHPAHPIALASDRLWWPNCTHVTTWVRFV